MGQRKTERIALISSERESDWVSCKTITKNLIASYRLLYAKQRISEFYLTRTPLQTWEEAKRIFSFNPSKLIFLDHAPHPHLLIEALARVYKDKGLPPLYFHLYGDFTLYSRQWLQTEPFLKGTSVHFICASQKQVALVSRFLAAPCEGTVSLCPFPVDQSLFHFDLQKRESWRKKLKLREDELSIVYSGRMSLQKNTTRLLLETFRFWQMSKKPLQLYFAGLFDELGAPLLGINYSRGFYYHFWEGFRSGLPEDFLRCVHYVGNLNSDDLCGLYNASDLFISLSLHHDEDYGMAPAEALCCGVPAILSNWGGYSSFYKYDDKDCKLVSVRMGEKALELSNSDVQEALNFGSKNSNTSLDRSERSQRYLSHLSIEAAKAIIGNIQNKPPVKFAGFSWLMKEYSESFNSGIMYKEGMKKGTLYQEIYENYIR